MTKQCTAPGCLRIVRCKGLCILHYVRLQRHGDIFYTERKQRGKLEPQAYELLGDYAHIVLPHGLYAIIDRADLALVLQFKWCRKPSGYALSTTAKLSMHQLILGKAPPGMHIDHINRNKLDNRRSNLRCVTPSVNIRNSVLCDRAKNYSWHAPTRKFRCYLTVRGTVHNLGYVATEEAAKALVNATRKKLLHAD